jgi:hypothetical protein
VNLEKMRYENVVYDFGKGDTVNLSLGTISTILIIIRSKDSIRYTGDVGSTFARLAKYIPL